MVKPKAKFTMTFRCCRCGYKYSVNKGFVTDLKDWKGGYSKKFLDATLSKHLSHFPIECPKCGLRHLIVVFPIPWEENVKDYLKEVAKPNG